MPTTQAERLPYDQRPDLRIGPVETYFSQVDCSFSLEPETVSYDIIGPPGSTPPSVEEYLSAGSFEVTLTGPAFLDEVVELSRVAQQGVPPRNRNGAGGTYVPVPVRHWIFQTPRAVVTSLECQNIGQMQSDGSGVWRAGAQFTMTLVETA